MFDAHPRRASQPILPSRQIAVDEFRFDTQACGQSFGQCRPVRGPVRFTSGQKSQHDFSWLLIDQHPEQKKCVAGQRLVTSASASRKFGGTSLPRIPHPSIIVSPRAINLQQPATLLAGDRCARTRGAHAGRSRPRDGKSIFTLFNFPRHPAQFLRHPLRFCPIP